MIVLFFYLITYVFSFKSPFLKGIHKPVLKEISSKTIIPKNSIFRKLDGFFGQIGPNPMFALDDEYSLFDGDGMIHGVFFNKTDLIYTNHWVKTKKLLTEMKWGKKMYISLAELKGFRGLTSILSSEIMKCFKLIPSGYTANTAFMYHNKKMFALHETDTPYRINLNFNNFTIHTGKHYKFGDIITTTAHPKFDELRRKIYLYSYKGLKDNKGKFLNNVFDYNFNLIEESNIDLINNGIIHDIGQTKNSLIIPDLPLKTDFNRIMENKLPIYFDKNGTTRLGVLNKDTDKLTWFNISENFFIFHFSECFEDKDNIYIHACLVDNVNFASFIDNTEFKPFQGTKISQIILNKKTNTYKIVANKKVNSIIKNTNYITEFPVVSNFNNKDIYCGIIDSQLGEVHGFLKINLENFETSIPKIYMLKNRVGNSECRPVVIDDIEYLLTYSYDKDTNYYINLIDVENGKNFELKLNNDVRIPPGFHSIYVCK